MKNTDNAPVAPTSMPIQRYMLDGSGWMETDDKGQWVSHANHLAALEAAKAEGVKKGLEAAAKVCTGMVADRLYAYDKACESCADAIRAIDHEEVLKGTAQ